MVGWSTRRFDVLVILGAAAFAVVVLIGAAVRERGHEPKFRARSGENVVALSVFNRPLLEASPTTEKPSGGPLHLIVVSTALVG